MTTIIVPKNKKSKKQQMVVSVSTTPSGRATVRTRTSRRRRNKPKNRMKVPSMVDSYMKSLADPFEHGPVRLGFANTMIPTTLASGYLRSSFLTNADGSFTCMLLPQLSIDGTATRRGGVYFSASAANSNFTAMGFIPFPQSAAIAQIGPEGRIVSAGLRLLPQVPLTNPGGMLFAGLIPSESYTNILSRSTNFLTNLPYSHWIDGRHGATVTTRPLDFESFNFKLNIVGGINDNELPYNPIPYISGLGFPPNTVVYYEASINLEILPTLNASVNASSVPLDTSDQPTLTDYFPSLDSLFKTVKRLLPETTTSSIVEHALGYLTGQGMAPTDALAQSLGSRIFRPRLRDNTPFQAHGDIEMDWLQDL